MGVRRISAPLVLGLIAVAAVSSSGSLALLELRMRQTESMEFVFLRTNLVLAWAPMALAVALFAAHRLRVPPWVCLVMAIPWLLFLPNAPYLVTDAVHLGRMWEDVPLWFDLLMIGAFGATGLLLGYASLYVVHAVIAERFGPVAGWGTAVAVFTLTSAGVYLGRVFRLNSWDAFTQPEVLVRIVARWLRDPFAHPEIITLLGTMAVLLAAGYLCFMAAGHAARRIAPVRQLTRR